MKRLWPAKLVLTFMISSLAAFSGPLSHLASADPGVIGATGGGPTQPPSAAELARSSAKEALLAARLASATSATSSNSESVLTTRSGYLLGYIYQEDQATNTQGQYYARNWCGPGATTSITAYWAVQVHGQANKVTSYVAWGGGSTGFMKHLAFDDLEVSNTYPEDTNPGDDVTSWNGFLNSTNSEGSTSGFYVYSSLQGYTDFQNKLATDFTAPGVPTPIVVWTSGMTGWNFLASHFVTIYGMNLDTDYVQWGDSAGYVQSGGATFGWHDDRTMSQIYSTYMVSSGQGFAW